MEAISESLRRASVAESTAVIDQVNTIQTRGTRVQQETVDSTR